MKNIQKVYPDRTDDRGCDYRYSGAVAIPAYTDYTINPSLLK